MIAENPRLPRWVPGGHPMNPLGVRALYLGRDVLDLYEKVDVGATVTVTWQQFASGGNFASPRKPNAPPSREMRHSDLPRWF